MGVKVRYIPDRKAYYIFISHKKRRKAQRVGSSKRYAEEIARAIRKELLSGNFKFDDEQPNLDRIQIPTLTEYFEKFQKTYLKTDAFRETTRASYGSSFKLHILPAMGSIQIDQIQLHHLESFVGSLTEKKLSKATIGIICRELASVLNHAVKNKLVSEHPAKGLSKLFKNAPVKHEEIQPLSVKQVKSFLETVDEHHPNHFCFFLLAIHTGMRSGELIGLKWGDINFDEKFLTVKRTINRWQEQQRPKNDKFRRVDLSDASVKALKEQKTVLYLKFGTNLPEWVFPNQNGDLLEFYNIRQRQFTKCLKLAELPAIRFHDLRHTFASLMIQNGKSMKYVQQMLGHSSIKITMDIYSHLQPGADRDSLNDLPVIDGRKLRPMGKLIKLN